MFLFTAVGLDNIDSYEAKITWQLVSNEAEQIKEFFVLYKTVTAKNTWKFKKTKIQEATLTPLQPSTDYMVRIVGYSASKEVYASDVVNFVTPAGM